MHDVVHLGRTILECFISLFSGGVGANVDVCAGFDGDEGAVDFVDDIIDEFAGGESKRWESRGL